MIVAGHMQGYDYKQDVEFSSLIFYIPSMQIREFFCIFQLE